MTQMWKTTADRTVPAILPGGWGALLHVPLIENPKETQNHLYATTKKNTRLIRPSHDERYIKREQLLVTELAVVSWRV